MLTNPLRIASQNWSRSILNRDNYWPVADQPETRSIERHILDGSRSTRRSGQGGEDGHR